MPDAGLPDDFAPRPARDYRAWYAHVTLSMLAAAYLSATRAHTEPTPPPPAEPPPAEPPPAEKGDAQPVSTPMSTAPTA